MKPIAVIPARYGSSRFPGKPLALLLGTPMIRHVVARCEESDAFARIIVATDDQRIAAAVRGFGGTVALTSAACASGTDRVAEVARSFAPDDAWVFVNVQGDEPAVHPETLRELTSAFDRSEVRMATLVRPLGDDERRNPHVVKAVLAADGRALYFSRADIPYRHVPKASGSAFAHLGLYGYRRQALLELSALPPSPLETTEGLEQLRALEAGLPIHCLKTTHRSVGVDSPADIPVAEELLRSLGFGS